jgi:hypothetical protein
MPRAVGIGKSKRKGNGGPPTSQKKARQSANGKKGLSDAQLPEKEVGTTSLLASDDDIASVADIAPELKVAIYEQSVAYGQELARQEMALAHQQQEHQELLRHQTETTDATTTTSVHVNQEPTIMDHATQDPVFATDDDDFLSFNNAGVDFDSLEAFAINEDAFGFTDGNQPRTKVAERQAKSRASLKIVRAILSIGVVAQQALALRQALCHPDIRVVAKAAGFRDNVAAHFQNEQTKKMIARALQTNSTKGHCNNDKAAYIESVIMSMTESPDNGVERKKRINQSQMAKSLGLNPSRGKRLFAFGKKKRKALIENPGQGSWSRKPKRKGFSNVTPDVKLKLRSWIVNHPHVIRSPIVNDTLLVRNPITSLKERVGKLLLEIPVRELHNDLIETPEKGGLAEAWKDGKVIISDSNLRILLPKELRPATERHKQMCCCETCITPRMLQSSLNAFRPRWSRKLTAEAERTGTPDDLALANAYQNMVLPNGSAWHPKPRDALHLIQCANPDPNVEHPSWCCVLRRCLNCPKYPIPVPERGVDDNAPLIKFHFYVQFTKCSRHGVLTLNAKKCIVCENQAADQKLGKISTRKELTLLSRPIGIYFREFYLPALEKYAHHIAHVKILSKTECGIMCQSTFEQTPGDLKTRHDYAERLSAVFADEIQSSHFGNGRSLSIEGSKVESFDSMELEAFARGDILATDLVPNMEFHSHFSNDSRQDAATSAAHLTVLLDLLKSQGKFIQSCTLYDETDGCAKQYRCSNAIYLLSVLASKYGITINRAIGAPGHGKDDVDGLNATDKRYLSGKFCMIGTPEANNTEKRMAANSMVEGATQSLAAECARLCSLPSRINGVKGHAKARKREEAATMNKRNYHVQNEDEEIPFTNLKMKTVGLPKGTYNGMGAMYNLRVDPSLGVGKAALRRIPCLCDGCLSQLKLPWQHGVSADNQARYKSSVTCKWWGLFLGLNDWKIVSFEPTNQSDMEEIEDTQAVALSGITAMMAEHVNIGSYGALSTEDPAANGYYVLQWTSNPYTLQDDTALTEYDPPEMVEKGALVCEANYWNKVPRAKDWYTPSLTRTIARLQFVIDPNISLEIQSNDCKLPNNCDKRQARQLGACRIPKEVHASLIDEIIRRDTLGFDHGSSESEEEDSGDDSDDDSDD